MMSDKDDISVVCGVQGGVRSLQFCDKPVKPGPHHDERGGGAAYDDGGDRGGDGGARNLLPHPKTKPNVVGGGLSARILLWEMRNGVGNEKCTESNTAQNARRRIGDRK